MGKVIGAEAIEIVNAPMDSEDVTIRFLLKVGAAVREGDVVAEVESDKATVEVQATASGTLAEILATATESVAVTTATPLFSIRAGGAAPAAAEPPPGEE